MSNLRLKIDGRSFRDTHGREVTVRGINVDASAKLPTNPHLPSHVAEEFYDGDNVSFVGRPFPLEDAHVHFSRLSKWGYNTIRYIFTWEAIESAGPGEYDDDFCEFTVKMLRIAKDYGFYIFMDPHQDVWSRFSGGSGAPMWTLYACGLNPQAFNPTEAAVVHNTYIDPENFPKMIWATNYYRLVCQVMFTLFFAGKDFAPKAIIEGQNIQDYLLEHYLNAVRHLAQSIHEAGDLEDVVVVGWESFNEPNRGLVGVQKLDAHPTEQKLHKGTSPTPWQAILTGSGRACEVETWDIGGMGPYKSGTALVDPKGVQAWLPASYDDSRYGWKRDPGWKLGECLWAQHGVWDPTTDTLLRPDYFAKRPSDSTLVDVDFFVNEYFMDHYRRYSKMIRGVHQNAILFCQPPVLEIPPKTKGTADDDDRTVYAVHYYDGITLMTKKWNRFWNVDVLGILRGRYLSPAFAIKIGETAIRNCFRDQLSAMIQEGIENIGEHPCVFTEIGIPFDMDDKYAYKTGDYSSQIRAMDANHFALEEAKVGYTLWNYASVNNHKWGENWNGEDLSIFSVGHDSVSPDSTTGSLTKYTDFDPVTPKNLQAALSTPSISSSEGPKEAVTEVERTSTRASDAFIRPSPVHTAGSVVISGFDLWNSTFTFHLNAPTPVSEDHPTEIFLPDFHFPPEVTSVEVSSGKWVIEWKDGIQRLRWWHGEDEQKLKVVGMKREGLKDVGEDDGYLDQCGQTTRNCAVM